MNAVRDASHDFDFFAGSFHIHNRRLKQPLTGSDEWYEFDGSCVARALWGGKANMEEGNFDSPLGRIESLTLRLYDPGTGQWSLYWATAKNGLVAVPNVGAFGDDGIGDFFSRESFAGRDIICRYRWSEITDRGCLWEQAFSVDEGATWETNWIMEFTRTH